MNQDPYLHCPEYTHGELTLRQVRMDDANDLLKGYSDPLAQPLFNSDGCTSDFCYSNLSQMEECIEFWLTQYQDKYYVRFAIVIQQRTVGTVEIFTRTDKHPSFGSIGMLRIDLHSDWEQEQVIDAILEVMEQEGRRHFSYDCLLIKAAPVGRVRRAILRERGYSEIEPGPITKFPHYYIKAC